MFSLSICTRIGQSESNVQGLSEGCRTETTIQK